MGLFRCAAGGVRDHVNLVACIVHCREGEGVVAYFRPQTGDHNFLLAVAAIASQHTVAALMIFLNKKTLKRYRLNVLVEPSGIDEQSN